MEMTESSLAAGDGEVARVLGRLEAKVAAIEGRIERLELGSTSRMATIEVKLDAVVSALAQGMGAMKLVHWLGGAAVAALGFLASIMLRHDK
jgi:hypothetical protein